MSFPDEYDALIDSALCRNESVEEAVLENAARLRRATEDEFAKAIADAHFAALIENAWREQQKEATFAEGQARLGRALTALNAAANGGTNDSH